MKTLDFAKIRSAKGRLRTFALSIAVLGAGTGTLLPSIRVVAAAEAAAPSKIGDLSSYRTIVVDTASMVNNGDLDGAKARIKDLEVSWDDAEPSLKPRSPAEWHAIDKAIDRALSDLRSGKPDATACKESLANLLKVMDGGGRS